MQGPGQAWKREGPYSQVPDGPVLGRVELLHWLQNEWLSCPLGRAVPKQAQEPPGEVKGLGVPGTEEA